MVKSKALGFTLVESIIAMVIMGFAMVTLISFLYPQIERSAAPHYQTRAANLGQSLMSQILSRGFDHNSNFDGGEFRCGEVTPCSTTLGRDGETSPAQFNDVDDYVGCWYTDTIADCGGTGYPLTTILTDDSAVDLSKQYAHFTVTISAHYVASDFSVSPSVTSMKRIDVSIDVGRYGEFDFTGFRGNY
ncbi:type IV pilus modification PilV family protein [Vibrio diazotrophicus]|uniref:MSHA pilin protein MshD n=1 Tax=Vibrio diazotrophicus TaxID=685 RepID=A0A329EA01_VIBDI|nr:prepilin-type N-terminal cleavage/methylation domain-containing protein [Vibrio diazotrophicus]PNH89355.1 MSHA biogenesis protein MshD [Vibrio diazotrophicus]RAS64492.1 MSHA pilin protein MshD [Vibrio diazotrophicus]